MYEAFSYQKIKPESNYASGAGLLQLQYTHKSPADLVKCPLGLSRYGVGPEMLHF